MWLRNDELLLVKMHMKPQLSLAAVDDEKTSKNKINSSLNLICHKSQR